MAQLRSALRQELSRPVGAVRHPPQVSTTTTTSTTTHCSSRVLEGTRLSGIVSALAFTVIVCLLTFFFVGTVKLLIRCANYCRGRNEPGGGMTTTNNNNETAAAEQTLYDDSLLARKAGLSPGLLLSERHAILQTCFQSRLCSFFDDEAPTSSSSTTTQNKFKADATEGTNFCSKRDECKKCRKATDQEEPMCCICLAEFSTLDDTNEQQQQLIQGIHCPHVFHYQCCLEWLDKLHNDCPCCRAEMISVAEFRQAAIVTLGQARVQYLQTLPRGGGNRTW